MISCGALDEEPGRAVAAWECRWAGTRRVFVVASFRGNAG